MPRSRSRSLESITRSTTASLERKVPLWRSMASTSVVLPWSTCAMIAMLRILKICPFSPRRRPSTTLGTGCATQGINPGIYGDKLGKSSSFYFIVRRAQRLFFDDVLDQNPDGASGIQIGPVLRMHFDSRATGDLQAPAVAIAGK